VEKIRWFISWLTKWFILCLFFKEESNDIKTKNNSSSSKENKKVLTSKNSKRNLKENDGIVDQEELEKYAKATRAFRNRNKKTYNELALSDVLSGIDTDEDNLSKSSKRIKTNNTPPKAILNDSPINNNTNSRNTEMVHRLKLVEKLLNDMMKSQDGWPFLKPVSRRDVRINFVFNFIHGQIKLNFFSKINRRQIILK
jgi:hypothetical protein